MSGASKDAIMDGLGIRQVRFRCLSKSVLAFNAGDVEDMRKHVTRRRTGLWPLEILPAVKNPCPQKLLSEGGRLRRTAREARRLLVA